MRRLATTATVACLLAWATPSAGQVNRCLMPDGTLAYTDRSCSALDGHERSGWLGGPYSPRLHYGRCAATLPDVVYELTSAIDNRDVNRLAGTYHWPGLSGSSANA